MNTWLTDIIRRTNDRIFSGADLARVMSYYAKLPARLRLSEELEKLEPGLGRKLQDELAKRYPERAVYTRPLAQDLVESLRYVNMSVLADEPRLLRTRWTDQLTLLLPALGVDPHEVRDAYLVLRHTLVARLRSSSWDVLRPAFDDLTDVLTAISMAPAVPA